MIYDSDINIASLGINGDFHIKGIFDRIIDDMYLDQIIETITLKDYNRILFLGVEEIDLCIGLAKKLPEVKIVAVDNNEEIIKEMRRKVIREDLQNISFIYNSRSNLPFEDNNFDIIILKNYLHLHCRVEKVLKEIKRLLKDHGGLFILETITNVEDNRFMDEFLKLKDNNHVKTYNEEEIILLLNKVGMDLKDKFKTSTKYVTNKIKSYETIKKKYEASIDKYDVTMNNCRITLSTEVINLYLIKKEVDSTTWIIPPFCVSINYR